jgi:hypothetical protein
MAKKIIRHELVSVNIPANSTLTRFVIPDLPNLREVLTFGLQVYTVDEVAVDIISRNPVCSHTNVLHNSFMTFVNYGGKEFLKDAPAIMFNTINQAQGAGLTATNWNEMDFKSLIGQRINFPKSFISFATPPATAVDTAYIFSVYYSLPLLQEKRDSGFSFSNRA